ncbi:hypothetical protein [Gimesia sp.]|uniref:hypothetical protein n=1 Tax=Gimesia sp. TaxID=2024833 RepID=UPI003A910CAF
MPINSVQFARSVCDEFIHSDPQAKELLKLSSSLNIPLVKVPYFSLFDAFAKWDSIPAEGGG